MLDLKINKTRFPELGFSRIGRDWRFIAMDSEQAIGPYYHSKAELLADLTNYARDYGLLSAAVECSICRSVHGNEIIHACE